MSCKTKHSSISLIAACLFMVCPASYVHAQSKIDSLQQEFYRAVDDSVRGELCRAIGWVHSRNNRTGEAIMWFNRSQPFDISAGRNSTAALTCRVLGGHWLRLDNHLRASESYVRAMRLFEVIGDTLGLVQALWNVGRSHTRKSDFTQSMKYYRRAYEMAKAVGHKGLMATSLWFIGIEYDFMYDKVESLKYLQQCLNIRKEFNNPRLLESTLNFIASVNTNGGFYEEAFDYLRRCRKIVDSLGDKSRLAMNHHGFGRTYREMGDLVTAVAYEKKALRLYRELKDLRNTEFTLRLLGTLHSRIGQYDSAMLFYDEAFEVTKLRGTRGGRRWHYDEMAEHYARGGDYERAIEFQRRTMALNDSVYNAHSFQSINRLTAVYEAARKDRRIALLATERAIDSLQLLNGSRELEQQRLLHQRREQERLLLSQVYELQQMRLGRVSDSTDMHAAAIEREHLGNAQQSRTIALQKAALVQEQLLRNTLVGSLIALLLLALLLALILRNRRITAELRTEAAELRLQAAETQGAEQQAEIAREEHAMQRQFTSRLIRSQEQERKRIAGALHDGIGQDLLIIKHSAMMALEDEERRNDHLSKISEISVEAVEDIRRLCRALRPYQLEKMGLSRTIRDMLTIVNTSSAIEIQTEIGEIDGLIPSEREIDLYRIVQEGLNNIVKHAEAAKAEVRLIRNNGNLILSISDDGKGFDLADRNIELRGGMGMQDMRDRMRMLAGDMRIETSPGSGTRIEAEIPITAVEAE